MAEHGATCLQVLTAQDEANAQRLGKAKLHVRMDPWLLDSRPCHRPGTFPWHPLTQVSMRMALFVVSPRLFALPCITGWGNVRGCTRAGCGTTQSISAYHPTAGLLVALRYPPRRS